MATNLCGRCAERVRARNIVKKTSHGALRRGECDNCKMNTMVATYEISPKRRMENGFYQSEIG